MSVLASLNSIPSWMGNAPVWALLGIVVVALIKVWPQLRKMTIDERLSIKGGYVDRIKDLEKQIKACQENCDEQERRLLLLIEQLRERLNNEALQRVQGEISLINTLIDVVDAPQLKQILSALEARQVRLQLTNVKELSQPGAEGAEDGEVHDERP